MPMWWSFAFMQTTYFPYWDRLQSIRTSKLWNVQVRGV